MKLIFRPQGIADTKMIRALPALPETADELVAMAGALGGEGAGLLLRENATESRIHQTDMSQYRVVAFATHGFVAGELGGMGLIRNAINQGCKAVDFISAYLKKQPSRDLDVVIVGAGPAGIAASLRAKELGLKFVTLEQDSLGGTVFKYPRGKLVMTAPVDLPLVGRMQFQEVSKEELLEIMKGNSLGLGVRCWHCHVGEEGIPFSEFDFESDEKLTKRKARFMLQMVRYLNDERLPGLGEVGERAEPSVRITCYTCHRGRPLPRTLGEVLAIVIDEDGIDAGIDRYGELRDELYGSGSYDFGELTLIELAQRLGSEGRVEDGIRILTLNLEHFPESAFSYFTLGEGYRMTGQREEAITAYRKAQELIPGNLMIDLRLEETLSLPDSPR